MSASEMLRCRCARRIRALVGWLNSPDQCLVTQLPASLGQGVSRLVWVLQNWHGSPLPTPKPNPRLFQPRSGPDRSGVGWPGSEPYHHHCCSDAKPTSAKRWRRSLRLFDGWAEQSWHEADGDNFATDNGDEDSPKQTGSWPPKTRWSSATWSTLERFCGRYATL